ncbi:MAG: hypothetical protein IT293_18455 [Deltaproteobacteria bacterium]|nr:hypothetical protein [Deltaproteobacteria bacterium]
MSPSGLIVPSETRSREFDAKLLLACVAAERGLRTVVGSRTAIHLQVAALPRSVWLAKDLFRSSLKMTGILRALGHRVVALDEEGLVWYSRARYLAARVAAPVMDLTEELFAWGEANADNWRAAPAWRAQPIHVTGNARVDLMRPELRGFFDGERRAVEARFGRPILINSNFGSVNHFVPRHGAHEARSVAPASRPESDPEADAFQSRLAAHRRKLFDAFRAVLPALARAFPERAIVVRPHPAENPETWRAAAAGLPNVEVLYEGSVVPWLLAAAVVLHNGCTTGIEANLLGTPVLAYRPWREEDLDLALPNELSVAAESARDLIAGCERALAGALAPSATALARQAELKNRHLAALSGRLAAERIVDRLAELAALPLPVPTWTARLRSRVDALRRRRKKLRNARLDAHKNSAVYTAHRFPPLTRAEVDARIARLQQLTGRFAGVRAEESAPDVFVIACP